MTLNDFNEWMQDTQQIIVKTLNEYKDRHIPANEAQTILLASIASSQIVIARMIVSNRLETDDEWKEYEPDPDCDEVVE